MSNVIEFKEAVISLTPKKKAATGKGPMSQCNHLACEFDEKAGTIHCLNCGEALTPDAWVRNLVYLEKAFEWNLLRLQKKIKNYTIATCPDCGKKFRHKP